VQFFCKASRGFQIQADFHGKELDTHSLTPWRVNNRDYIDEKSDGSRGTYIALKPTSDAASKSKQALYLRIKYAHEFGGGDASAGGWGIADTEF
jgi:hypothetical protein